MKFYSGHPPELKHPYAPAQMCIETDTLATPHSGDVQRPGVELGLHLFVGFPVEIRLGGWDDDGLDVVDRVGLGDGGQYNPIF